MKNAIFTYGIRNLIRISLFTVALAFFAIPGFAQLGWVQVASISPGSSQNSIRGISGTSSSDVWAVGYFSNTSPTPEVFQDLIIHWNGSTWQQFPPLNLSTSFNDLWDVEAISSNNVWAVGNYHNVASRAELLHFDGASWTNQPLPVITGGSFLKAIHAVSPTDIWAVGRKAGAITGFPPYVIHYNGSTWTEMTVTTTSYLSEFWDIHGIANDLWAVGYKGNAGNTHSLAMHWNGSNWSDVSLPSSVVTPLSQINSVKMISPNNVWAIGTFLAGGMFTIHWDGTAWTVVSSTSGSAVIDADLAAVTTNNVSAVAREISHWNGTAWSTVDPLTEHTQPILRSTVVFSNEEIWAGGHAFDLAANKYVTLVYRSVNNTPEFAGGNTQSWNVGANTNNNSPGNLLLTSDPDVSQILTYAVETPPAHGTLSGLPTTAITNNGSALPTGIGYTPAQSYQGTDQFVMRVTVGPVSTLTTINVNVLGALPVTLVDFQVSKQGYHALLKWATVSESNTQKFEVEHSTDGIHFTAVGSVAARGNSNTVYNYSFTHHSPVPGQNYYRLKLVDMDGRTTIFPIRSVLFDAGSLQPIILLSNPIMNNDINLQMNITGAMQVNIYNMQGQRVLAKNINNTSAGAIYKVTLPNAGKGIYIMEVNSGQQKHSYKLFLQ